MDKPIASKLEDDLNLRSFVLTILHHWRILAIFCLAAALPTAAVSWLTPVEYRATVIVSIPDYLIGKAPIVSLLQSDEICQAVQSEKGMAPDVVGRISILTNQSGKSVYEISDRASQPDQAAAEANAWADASIQWLVQNFLNEDRIWLKKTQTDLDDADGKLLEFLDANALNKYSLIDLRIYEGMVAPSDFNYPSGDQTLALEAPTRETLRALLLAQANAAAKYSDAQDNYNQHQLQLQTNGPEVLNRAIPPEQSGNDRLIAVLKNSALALLIGLLSGILIVFILEWWKAPIDSASSKL